MASNAPARSLNSEYRLTGALPACSRLPSAIHLMCCIIRSMGAVIRGLRRMVTTSVIEMMIRKIKRKLRSVWFKSFNKYGFGTATAEVIPLVPNCWEAMK